MTLVVVEVERIDDAVAREAQALLAREVRNFIDDAVSERMRGAVEESRVEQAGDIVCDDRSVSDPTVRGDDLDERLEPTKAARPIAHDPHIEAARYGLCFDLARNRFGTASQRGRIARHVDGRAHACTRHASSRRSTASVVSRPCT